MSSIDAAIRLAANAHAGQKRKDGTSYILHPLRVMMRQTSEAAMIVAVLHDIVEDTDVNFDNLHTAGFPDPILDALRLLTHSDDTPYDNYIQQIEGDPLALAVKIADLEDNMNLQWFRQLTDKDLQRTAKYHRAWLRLKTISSAT